MKFLKRKVSDTDITENESEDEDITSQSNDSIDDNHSEDFQSNNNEPDDNDSENFDSQKETEELTAQKALAWIRNEQDDAGSNPEDWEFFEPREYPDIDYQHIVNELTTTDLQEVLAALLEEDIDNNGNDNFDHVKKLVEYAPFYFQIDNTELVDQSLARAIQDEDEDKIFGPEPVHIHYAAYAGDRKSKDRSQ